MYKLKESSLLRVLLTDKVITQFHNASFDLLLVSFFGEAQAAELPRNYRGS